MTTLRFQTIALLSASALLIGVFHVLTSESAAQDAFARHGHTPECSDGIDNDGDANVDYPQDSDCGSPDDEYEVSYDQVQLHHPPRHGARLSVSVSDGKDFALQEEVLKYRFVVKNGDRYPATATLRTTVPSEFIIHSVSGPHRKEGRKVIWDNLELGPRQAREFYVTGHIDRSTPDYLALRMRASAEGAVATDHTTVGGQSIVHNALELSLSDGRKAVVPGDLLTYEVHLDNVADLLVTNLDVNAALPNQTEFVSASEGGHWTGSNIRWDNLTVAAGGSRLLHYTVRVRPDARLGASVRAGVQAGGVQAYDVTDIRPVGDGNAPRVANFDGRVLSKVANKSEVQPGQTVTYTVSIRNTTDWPFRNISVEDKFDHRLMRVVSMPEGKVHEGKLHWHVPEIAPGQAWSARYTVQVHPEAPHGTTIDNVVSVTGEGLEQLNLQERVYTYRIGVLTQLPKTGAGMDAILLALNALLGLAPAYAVARRKVFLS